MVIPELTELTPFLTLALKIISTLFLLVSIAKLSGADIDRLLFFVFLGLSVFFGYYMFYVSQALAVGFVLLIIYRLFEIGKKPRNGRFVPPEFDELRRLEDEREWERG